MTIALGPQAPGGIGAGHGGGGAIKTSGVGVTNRTAWNQGLISVPTNQGYAREHYASPEGTITDLVFIDCGWYLNDTFTISVASTGTIKRYIEYPAGVYTPVLWAGASTVSLPANGQTASDPNTIQIPANAKFWEHIIRTSGATGNMAAQELPTNSSTIDITDTTYVYSGSGDPVRPAANAAALHLGASQITGSVLGIANASAFCITGDSIAWGQGDISSASARGDSSFLGTGIGQRYAYTKLTKPGMTGVQLAALSGQAPLLTLIAALGVTDLLSEWGGGDLRDGNTVGAIKTGYQTIYGLFPGKRIGQTTIVPRTDSTDSWATVANQTPKTDGNWANDVTLNTDIRAGLANVNYFIETSDVASSAHDSRKWTTPPVPVADGVHPNSYMARGPLADAVYRHKLGRSAIIPNAVGSPAITGVGSVTLAFSFVKPTLGTNIITYLVEYKRTVDSSWTQFVTGSSALTGTITGLTASTSYDLRITPSNDGGPGAASTITQSTGSAFQPLDLGANLGFAWDTNNTSKVTDTAGTLTQMGDLYTGNVLAIGGAPTVITNGGQTGTKRVLVFPAGAYFKGYQFAALLAIPGGATATSQVTVVEALKHTAAATSRGFIWGTQGTSKANIGQRATVTNRGASVVEVDARTAVTALQTTVETSNYHVFTTIKNGLSLIFRVDGVQVATGTLAGDGTWNFTDFYIGTSPGTSQAGTPSTVQPPANYSGLVIARTALSGADLTNVEAWVGATAGL